LVLIGNGKLYGGAFEIFPKAKLDDGLFEICIFPKANWLAVFRAIPNLLAFRKLPKGNIQFLRAANFELSGKSPAAFELDGEWIGELPATFTIERERLRLIAP
jgi:diacylglycerol kinase family enzyme